MPAQQPAVDHTHGSVQMVGGHLRVKLSKASTASLSSTDGADEGSFIGLHDHRTRSGHVYKFSGVTLFQVRRAALRCSTHSRRPPAACLGQTPYTVFLSMDLPAINSTLRVADVTLEWNPLRVASHAWHAGLTPLPAPMSCPAPLPPFPVRLAPRCAVLFFTSLQHAPPCCAVCRATPWLAQLDDDCKIAWMMTFRELTSEEKKKYVRKEATAVTANL